MKGAEALIASAMAGLDADVVQFLLSCLEGLGHEPALSDIDEVLAPFVLELGLPADRGCAELRACGGPA